METGDCGISLSIIDVVTGITIAKQWLHYPGPVIQIDGRIQS